ncbi:MAG TPA: FAD-binding oxidoreductase [Burkholderiaceae bacterium]|nr:FAD-binding oxidoreductase [Burkholderiaceae bacterium]
MDRRRLLRSAAAPLLAGLQPGALTNALAAPGPLPRVRPGDAAWPSEARWAELGERVGGRLLALADPFKACRDAPAGAACAELFGSLKNPHVIGDSPALTQTLGWVDAWTSRTSAYAVAAQTSADVVAAVNFARAHRLRLVVKGGGHSYQGTSNAADSLLVWTRGMRAIALHDAFVGAGCTGPPQPAVTVEAGALWGPVFDAVTTRGGRYVQGGGCLTVGVAGLVQSGGFGSFSKGFGLAAASLLQAEVVTADGMLRIANACTNPELFWGLKGGGGGSLGVVTRLTLRTHVLPASIGAVNMTIQANSDAAYRRLIGLVTEHCRDRLMNPHWGEQIVLARDNVLRIAMVFQGLDRGAASAVWQPFIDAVSAAPREFQMTSAPFIVALPARRFWEPGFLKLLPGVVVGDNRPGAPPGNIIWSGDQGQVGQVLHGYQSAWLPAALLQPDRRESLGDALFAATRHWQVALHLNKGLAGAPDAAIAAARDTAMNPAVLDAFALAIVAAGQAPAYPGVAGHEPDAPRARQRSQAVADAMAALRGLMPNPGSYLAESDFFEPDWPRAFWGANLARLQAVKRRYDPDGLFFAHHSVGSERWSADGFTPLR